MKRIARNPKTGLYWNGCGFSEQNDQKAKEIPDGVNEDDFHRIFSSPVEIVFTGKAETPVTEWTDEDRCPGCGAFPGEAPKTEDGICHHEEGCGFSR